MQAEALKTAEPWLVRFADESNKIEGMPAARSREIEALQEFIGREELTVENVRTYVLLVAPGHRLRSKPGLNVRVGNHIAPAGGPDIEILLKQLLATMPYWHPYRTHVAYETLHPFTDGNGRSGRAIWLWHHLRYGNGERAKQLGFLHSFYYETLEFSDGRSLPTNSTGGGEL